MIERPPRPVLRPLPRWVVIVGIPVMVLVAAGAVWLLLGTGVGGEQLDAIRTGSALGVGLGGIVVLWLAVRRQRSTELDLLQKYEAHQLAERVAAAGERDATARRITDLYAKAVDQLGSEQAPVRLGGLYALERLAQDNADPQLRQTVVNMICAYLRMPAQPPRAPRPLGRRRSGQPLPIKEPQQEGEVRLTAQRILEKHLKVGPDPDHPPTTFWPHIDIDLRGATLTAVNFAHSRIRAADFREATFTGKVSFRNTKFDQDADFSEAEFATYAIFNRTLFAAFAFFYKSRFGENAWFDDATFGDGSDFGSATFGGEANFDKTVFTEMAGFDEAEFLQHASFNDARFDDQSWFGDARFAAGSEFHRAYFGDDAGFSDTRFDKDTAFDNAVFATTASFDGARITPDSTFAAIARVDGVDTDQQRWPDGWRPGEPVPMADLPGLWVSLHRD